MSNPFDAAAEAFKPLGETMKKAAAGIGGPSPLEAKERLILREPGEYDIAEDDYHSDPCLEPSLSASILKVMAKRSPRHGMTAHPRLNPEFEREEKAAFDFGSAFHTLILGKGALLQPLDFKDWKTDASKAARKDARGEGLIPLLRKDFERAESMARAVKAQIPGHEYLNAAMTGGRRESVFIWQEETPAGPIWCRMMADWTPNLGSLAPDWKSTAVGAGPDEWGAKTMWQMDSHIQAAFYKRGWKKVLGIDLDLFFAVAEIEPPYALACMRPAPSAVAMAERTVQWGINVWGMCLHSGRWPGYSRELAWVDAPPWKERGQLEREERGEMDSDYWKTQLDALEGVERPARADVVGDDNVDVFGLAPLEGQS